MSTTIQTENPATRRGAARARGRGALVALLLLALLALAGFKGWRLYAAARAFREDARAIEAQARAGMSRESLAQLGPRLAQARADAMALRGEAAPLLPLAPYLGWVPTYGGDIAAARPLLDAAVEATDAASRAFEVMAPLLPADGAESSLPLAARLVAARPQIEEAHAAIRRAAEAWKQVPIDTLSPSLRSQARQVDQLLPLMQGGLDLALAAPNVLADLRALAPYAKGTPDRASLARLAPIVAQTRADLVALQSAAGPLLPLTRRLGASSAYGADLTSAGTLLDLGVNMSVAGDELLQALLPVLRPADAAEPVQQTLAERLAGARTGLARARAALERADASWRRLPLAQLSPPLRDGLARLEALLPAARDSVDLALAAPGLLGADGRRDYLLLALNNDELRATGGFISGAGVLSVDKGRLVDFSLGDSVAVDDFSANPYPDPPEPLLRYMNIEVWVFRDTNWSPDFPTSARAASDLYRLGQTRAISNVVAIDQTAVQRLLAVTGPLDVEGMPAPISVDNVIQEMRAPSGFPEEDSAREAFKGLLAQALLKKLETDGAKLDMLALARALRDMLDQRHLQILVDDPEAAAAFADRGWDGAVAPGPGDFLMVVDTNMGYNKVNPNVRETIGYTVDLRDPANPAATVNLRHQHMLPSAEPCIQWRLDARPGEFKTGYDDWMARCYYDYLRVLAPNGIQLRDSKTNPTPAEWMDNGEGDDGAVALGEGDAGTSELSTFLVVPHGETRDTSLAYGLPAGVVVKDGRGWRYRLKLQKQAGTDATPYSVTLRLPPGARVVAAQPAPDRSADGSVTFAGTLDVDKTIDVTFGSNP